MTRSATRPYRSKDHLRATIAHPAGAEHGAVAISPQEADRIVFDIAKHNHLPANLPDGDHGSRVLDIGGGVYVRASGSAHLQPDGSWKVTTRLHASQYPSGRDLTAKQDERARDLIGDMISDWAATHAGDIAQADDIDRNNAAHTLEETIATHEQALVILREQLAACDEGEPFTQFPDLPTKR